MKREPEEESGGSAVLGLIIGVVCGLLFGGANGIAVAILVCMAFSGGDK